MLCQKWWTSFRQKSLKFCVVRTLWFRSNKTNMCSKCLLNNVCQHQQWWNKIPDQKINFCSKLNVMLAQLRNTAHTSTQLLDLSSSVVWELCNSSIFLAPYPVALYLDSWLQGEAPIWMECMLYTMMSTKKILSAQLNFHKFVDILLLLRPN